MVAGLLALPHPHPPVLPLFSSLPPSWVCYTSAASCPPGLGDRTEGGSREFHTTQRAPPASAGSSSCQVSIPSHTHPQHPRGAHFYSPALTETTPFLLRCQAPTGPNSSPRGFLIPQNSLLPFPYPYISCQSLLSPIGVSMPTDPWGKPQLREPTPLMNTG